MKRGFIASVLSTQKQRQRFIWARNMISLGCAVWAYQAIGGGGVGAAIAVAALVAAYLTVAPILAFVACLIEQMYS